MSKITHKPLTSSMLKSAGHDPETNTMEVTFSNGTTYRYSGVDAKTYADFISAESHGKHFGQHIRGKFDCTKVEEELKEPTVQ